MMRFPDGTDPRLGLPNVLPDSEKEVVLTRKVDRVSEGIMVVVVVVQEVSEGGKGLGKESAVAALLNKALATVVEMDAGTVRRT